MLGIDVFSDKTHYFTCAWLIFTCGWAFRTHVDMWNDLITHVASSNTCQFYTRHFTCVWLIDVHTWLSFPFTMITCETTWSVASPAQTRVFSDTNCNFSQVRVRFLHVVGSFVPHVLVRNHQGRNVRGLKCSKTVYSRVFSSPWSHVKPHVHKSTFVFRQGKCFH